MAALCGIHILLQPIVLKLAGRKESSKVRLQKTIFILSETLSLTEGLRDETCDTEAVSAACRESTNSE